MYDVVALDSETTTWNKGHVFDKRNFPVCWSYATYPNNTADAVSWGDLTELQWFLQQAKVLVFFNGKFDLQWFVSRGLVYPSTVVWDVEIAHFIYKHQTTPYPSLDEVCTEYGIPTKPDEVKKYWDQGVNTNEIPWEVLREYATHDAKVTLLCYLKQQELLTPKQKRLVKLQSMDMSVLREMEANGLPFDEQLCQVRAKELDDKISEITRELSAVYPNIPINFNSNDDLSAFLYGGVIKEDSKEFIGYFKTGERAGQPKYKNVVIEHVLPRLYTPLKGTQRAAPKQDYYRVSEDILRKLKGKRGVLNNILELAKYEKLNGTYYRGLIALRKKMGWDEGVLHGNFNQCVAATGRLSSSKPNLQNFASELQDIFISRYTA